MTESFCSAYLAAKNRCNCIDDGGEIHCLIVIERFRKVCYTKLVSKRRIMYDNPDPAYDCTYHLTECKVLEMKAMLIITHVS